MGSLASIRQLSFIASRKLFSRLPFVLLLFIAVRSPQTEKTFLHTFEKPVHQPNQEPPLPTNAFILRLRRQPVLHGISVRTEGL